jgi:hypothetical protein
MPLLWTYEEARLLLEAKGWGITKAAAALSKKPELTDFDVSQASLSRNTSGGKRIAIEPEVAIAIEALETQNWYQGRTEIVIAGLRALHGSSPEVDARELALALLAHFPTNDLALKLGNALLAQAQIASGNGSLLDVFAQAIAGRLPRINTAKLARFVARRITRTVPLLSFGRLAYIVSVASIMAVAVAGGVWLVLDAMRGHATPRSAVSLVASVGPDGEITSDPRDWFAKIAEGTGEKPVDQPVPFKPFPGQKVPPCDASYGEEEVNGGCYMGTNVKPPCGKLYRSGNTCYRVIAAEPKKPNSHKEEH